MTEVLIVLCFGTATILIPIVMDWMWHGQPFWVTLEMRRRTPHPPPLAELTKGAQRMSVSERIAQLVKEGQFPGRSRPTWMELAQMPITQWTTVTTTAANTAGSGGNGAVTVSSIGGMSKAKWTTVTTAANTAGSGGNGAVTVSSIGGMTNANGLVGAPGIITKLD